MASVEKGDERSGVEYQLEEALDRALDEAARRLDPRRSDVVRMALRQFLFGGSRSDRPAERVRNPLGSVEAGISLLGEAHIAVAGRRIL